MRTLRISDRGEDVMVVQRKLNVAVDGIFGTNTDEAVREFQRSRGLAADGMVGRQTWAALDAMTAFPPRYVDKIIVHCTATPDGKDFSVGQIDAVHRAQGWDGIGYHYVIYRDGSIHKGRYESVAGAHTRGHNANSIGVCYVGGLSADGKTPKDTRTAAQKTALVKLLRELRGRYPNATIHGHREFANKACPSFDARSEYAAL